MSFQRQFFVPKPRIENKLRDLFVFLDIRHGSLREEVASRYGISPSRVSQISHKLFFEILYTDLSNFCDSSTRLTPELEKQLEQKMIDIANKRITTLMSSVFSIQKTGALCV